MKSRVVGHIDLDYFYAQVEETQNPSIKGRPVIVCVFSGRTDESGVVSTANYQARELGVTSGMPIVLAKKRLEGSNAAVIRMVHEKYEAVSDRVMKIVKDHVDVLEQTGIDEAFFDLTSSTAGEYEAARAVAERLKSDILESERLTCSVGIGQSKAVAKLASDTAKPGGLLVVSPASTKRFLDGMPVTKLYGVGPKTASALKQVGVTTIGQLSVVPMEELERLLGKRSSAYLRSASTGTDDNPVTAGQEPTQFSRIITLKRDTRDANEAMAQLAEGIEDVRRRLASSSKSFRTLSAIGILTDLSMHTRSKTFDAPINHTAAIRDQTLLLFKELSGSVHRDFRRVGVRVSELSNAADQSSLSEFIGPAANP